MFKPWIYFCVLAVAFSWVTAAFPSIDDYDTWYSDELKELGILSEENNSKQDVAGNDEVKTNVEKSIENILGNLDDIPKIDSAQTKESAEKVAAEIEKFINENIETNKDIDNVNDYQIEDNRSNLEDDLQNDVADSVLDKDIDLVAKDSDVDPDAAVLPVPVKEKEEEENKSDGDVIAEDQDVEANSKLSLSEENDDVADAKQSDVEKSANQANDDDDKYVAESIKDIEQLLRSVSEEKGEKEQSEKVAEHAVEPLASMETFLNESDEDKEIMEEVKSILNEDASNNFGNDESVKAEEQPAEIVDEAKKIIEDIDDAMDDDNNEEAADASNENVSDEDSIKDGGDEIEKIEDEKNDDLLKDADDKIDAEQIEDENIDPLLEDEESVDKAYEDLNADLDKLLKTWDKIVNDESVSEEDDIADDVIESDEILDSEEDDSNEIDEKIEAEENKDDKNVDDWFESWNDAIKDDVLEYEAKYGKPYNEESILKQREDLYENIDDSNLSEIFKDHSDENSEGDNDNDDDIEQNNAEVAKPEETVKDAAIQYINDGLAADETKKENPTTLEKKDSQPNSEELSDAQLEDLNDQFADEHMDEIIDNIAKQSAPIALKLSLDEPTIVTSPNFPNNYPTNNIIDWVLDGQGEGMGIEFNITNFHVNGLLGDYVLVQPGQIDDSGEDGFVITHHLNGEKLYRFMDVDKMFIRFQSMPGMSFRQGFRFSVKLIAPLPEPLEIVEPEEPTFEPLREYVNVILGGVSVEKFLGIREEFRRLVADMATMYINAKGINPGLNATIDVTQITNVTVCNINWPDYENCASVRFGVPLQYDEVKDPRLSSVELKEMWNTYVDIDPFAVRLRRLGVTEFAIPDDDAVLMVWLVIAAGVVISMAMLAFAMWRFSCFEGYTRMQSYSDTDSIHNMKKGLDLYPTPHQTLPPLYGENEYKWVDDKYDDSTRVDMGGFANKSYIRDDLFDIDSDEDVIPTRERGAIAPRDIYNEYNV